MAADFWASSHHKQLLDHVVVNTVHPVDKVNGITLEDFKLIKMQMSTYISKLAHHVKVRQRVSLTDYDPRLVAPACLYLASKAEESAIQARVLVFYIKKLYTNEKYKYEIKDILEMEMKVLEALEYYLVVFHPYNALCRMLHDAGINDPSVVQFSWGLVNDTYKMDLVLMYPPHLIALACIHIACACKEIDATVWFEELTIDLNLIKTISMEILDFYDGYGSITDDKISNAFNKVPSSKLGVA